MDRPLDVGEYCGQSVRRRMAHGFVLTENRFQAGMAIAPHRHRLAHFTCVLSGSFVETYDSLRLECPAGSVLIVPAGRDHTDEIGPDGAHTLSIEVGPKTRERLRESCALLEEPAVLTGQAVSRLVDRLYNEFRAQDPASLLMLSALAYEVLAVGDRMVERAKEPTWMPQAMKILHQSVDQPVGLGALAERVGVHEAHLARTFRRINGCTVGDYVRFLRLERAKAKLADPGLSLSTIALEAGFYDQAHFSREFKKAFGMTPSAFRKTRNAHPNSYADTSTPPSRNDTIAM
ncbi:MAG: helix-turn-helix domain-containing protein [Armatimonadetes bacterium]|nr:helix-turn-helix domain-containing protein [Armatimonadota bacterium]